MRIIRHYKGGLYTLIGEAVHTERDGEVLVIYANAEGRLFARPVDSFSGAANHGDGPEPRFRPVQTGGDINKASVTTQTPTRWHLKSGGKPTRPPSPSSKARKAVATSE